MSNTLSKVAIWVGLPTLALATGIYIGYHLRKEIITERSAPASPTIEICLREGEERICSRLSCSEARELVDGLVDRMNAECYQTEDR